MAIIPKFAGRIFKGEGAVDEERMGESNKCSSSGLYICQAMSTYREEVGYGYEDILHDLSSNLQTLNLQTSFSTTNRKI